MMMKCLWFSHVTIEFGHVSTFREMFAYMVWTKKSLHGVNREGVHLALSPELGTRLKGAFIQDMHLWRVHL